MKNKESLLGKNSVDVVNFLLSKYSIREFYYRAYITKSERKYDKEFSVSDLKNLDSIYKEFKTKDSRYLIAFQSKVLTNDGYKHFPMIDFSNYMINDIDVKKIENVLMQLDETNGFILDSGRCFHYYGDRLLAEEEWLVFMKNCMQYPEIGERYISHQLTEGRASLRLVTDDSKPKNPVVVKVFDSSKQF